MMIAEAIMFKYPSADPTRDFIVQNDGEGSYIAEWNLRAPIPTQKELETWWEELQKNPPYEPPDQVELLAQELSQEKLARKQLEELNKTLGNELSDIKLSLLSLKGDLAE
ncbi:MULTISPECIES: XkdW family protein [Bacillus]|uniref:XkdW family protein n=1 Tax=Bacillus TaxID=1386 RepID=UPI0002A13C31|nr:XkdW family protein [Bacillus subtilis]AGA22037.1 Phage-like element PBSX protein XkdW [Bacillus subtilis subsp. subtilis str. BSP1]AMR47572.1 phage portal protein [Bacillus subtilis subsp. subtilis]KMN93047.1 phage portal protein [Bacillus subtilis]MBG8574672.1 phage portal protein [Bacillus subtilis]MBG9628419.1 phage portal protein [Bacillus subtilis]